MIECNTLSHPKLRFDSFLPQAFSGVRVPQARIATARGTFGTVTFQSAFEKDYSLHYSVFDLKEPFILRTRSDVRGLYTRIMLENHITHNLKESKDLTIREGQFSMANAEYLDARMEFDYPDQYTSFDICFSPSLAKKIVGPLAADLEILESKSSQPQFLLPAPRATKKETQSLVHNLLTNPRTQNNVEELLIHLVHQLLEDKSAVVPAQAALKQIYSAEELIAANLRKHYLLPELAKRANTNIFYLKKYFPFVFGVPPYQYLIRLRMRKAKKLLILGNSIKTTASECGYSSLQDFSKAFKKYYGFSPEDWPAHF